jgi:hypothetical protein
MRSQTGRKRRCPTLHVLNHHSNLAQNRLIPTTMDFLLGKTLNHGMEIHGQKK